MGWVWFFLWFSNAVSPCPIARACGRGQVPREQQQRGLGPGRARTGRGAAAGMPRRLRPSHRVPSAVRSPAGPPKGVRPSQQGKEGAGVQQE